jgi:hypothetical protein
MTWELMVTCKVRFAFEVAISFESAYVLTQQLDSL